MATQHCHRVVLMMRRPSCQRISLKSVTVSGRCAENRSTASYSTSVMVQNGPAEHAGKLKVLNCTLPRLPRGTTSLG